MPKIPHKNKYLRYIFWVMAIVWAAPGTGAQGAAVSADDGARDYPNRPIRFILPGGPGSSADVFSRILTAKMSDVMGQQVVVDSRPGAGGMLGTDIAAKATPDGYTDRKSTRLNSSHSQQSRMPSSA